MALVIAGPGRPVVLSVRGAESEKDYSYAALHQLLHPLDFSVLPAHQREALEVALGLSTGPVPSPYLVGLAAHALLVAAAPVIVLVRDEQWVDEASRHALAFVERRLPPAVAGRELADELLRAAEDAVEAGRREDLERLLDTVRQLDLSARQRALVTWLPSAFDDGVHALGPGSLVGLAEELVADGELDLAMRIFWSIAMRCFWVEPGEAARARIAAVARRLPIAPDDPRLLAMNAYVSPISEGDAVVAGLRAAEPSEAAVFRLLGSAALQVGAFEESVCFSVAAQEGFRASGKIGLLARSLTVQAWSRVRLGDLAGALPAAREGLRLARETSQPYMSGLALAVLAQIAAMQGSESEEPAAEAERIGLAAGARPVLVTVQLARGLAALGEGRYADAFQALRRIHDPADPAYQLALRRYVLPELTEAAVRGGHADEARKIVSEFAETSSPALAIGLRYARALLASDDEAERLYQAALSADLTRWPLERGRLHLAFGAWLRRHRRPADARAHLRVAQEVFTALGMPGWAARAAVDLRATGETRTDGELTEHELTIARLAADGLTNKEIGERLQLSHRTVSTHLHRIFPKLGVTSRTELAAALDRRTA